MKCMYCGCLDSKVIDSRANDEGTSIRRRRECISCGKRFTTYENIETTPLMVVKASGARQAFSAAKLLHKRGRDGLSRTHKMVYGINVIKIQRSKI